MGCRELKPRVDGIGDEAIYGARSRRVCLCADQQQWNKQYNQLFFHFLGRLKSTNRLVGIVANTPDELNI